MKRARGRPKSPWAFLRVETKRQRTAAKTGRKPGLVIDPAYESLGIAVDQPPIEFDEQGRIIKGTIGVRRMVRVQKPLTLPIGLLALRVDVAMENAQRLSKRKALLAALQASLARFGEDKSGIPYRNYAESLLNAAEKSLRQYRADLRQRAEQARRAKASMK